MDLNKKIYIEKIKKEAELLYQNGDFYCSEAIIATIRKHFDPDMPKQMIAVGSGFPIGMNTLCACGAVTGGIIVLGYFFGRTEPKDIKVNKAMELAKELSESFKKENKVLCCKILTNGMELGSPTHLKQCISFTGKVAAKTAEIIARELNIGII